MTSNSYHPRPMIYSIGGLGCYIFRHGYYKGLYLIDDHGTLQHVDRVKVVQYVRGY